MVTVRSGTALSVTVHGDLAVALGDASWAALAKLTVTRGWSSSSMATVAVAAAGSAPTRSGSGPKATSTLSPSSSMSSLVAVSAKAASVAPASKVTAAGTPDQSSGVAPPRPVAASGILRLRWGSRSSTTRSSAAAPSAALRAPGANPTWTLGWSSSATVTATSAGSAPV